MLGKLLPRDGFKSRKCVKMFVLQRSPRRERPPSWMPLNDSWPGFQRRRAGLSSTARLSCYYCWPDTTVWNSLPDKLRNSDSFDSFKRFLKTIFISRYTSVTSAVQISSIEMSYNRAHVNLRFTYLLTSSSVFTGRTTKSTHEPNSQDDAVIQLTNLHT